MTVKPWCVENEIKLLSGVETPQTWIKLIRIDGISLKRRSIQCPLLTKICWLKDRLMSGFILPGIRDVEVIKFLMLPLPAPLELLCFRVRCRFHSFEIFCFCFQLRIVISRFPVRFHFQSFSSKCFRFYKSLTASTAFSFRSTSLFVSAATGLVLGFINYRWR